MPNDARAWFTASAGRRVTATEIAQILGVSRTTVNRYLEHGVSSTDLITVCRHLNLSPLAALVAFGHLTDQEVSDYKGAGEGAHPDRAVRQLVTELAARALTTAELATIIADRESTARPPKVGR